MFEPVYFVNKHSGSGIYHAHNVPVLELTFWGGKRGYMT